MEVELRKICTTPARANDSEVKIVKTPGARDVFWSWKCVSRGRRRELDTLQNTWQAQEFVRVAKTLAGKLISWQLAVNSFWSAVNDQARNHKKICSATKDQRDATLQVCMLQPTLGDATLQVCLLQPALGDATLQACVLQPALGDATLQAWMLQPPALFHSSVTSKHRGTTVSQHGCKT